MLGTVVCLTGAYCYACPPPDESGPNLAGVYTIPSVVWAAPGAVFTVRARVLDESGHALPAADHAEVRWTSDPSAILPPRTASSVTVTAPGTGTFSLKAKFRESDSAIVSVHVTAGPAPTDMDWVAANHGAGDPPAMVLVDGTTSVSVNDTLIAIAGKGPIDYFTCPSTDRNCGEVTLLSRSQRVYRDTGIALTDGCQAVELNGPAGFPPECTSAGEPVPGVRPVPVDTIYVFASDAGLDGADESSTDETSSIDPEVLSVETAKGDLAHAQTVLEGNWTGLSIAPMIKRVPGSEISITLGESNSCTSGPKGSVKDQLAAADVPRDRMKGSTITVAYVLKLLLPDGNELDGVRGGTCPWSEEAGSIILISWAQRLPTTLAHEVMHALGPWQEPPWGHTNGVPGLDSQNMLWDGEDPNTPTPRSLLTLGQAFRFSLDEKSIFHRGDTPLSTDANFRCQGIMSSEESPCPRLTKDVIRP